MRFIIVLALLSSKILSAQVTGGESVYQFLRLPNSAHASSMGGMCVSNPSNDVALSMMNPALLRPIYNQHFSINQNFYIAGTSFTNVFYAKHYCKLNTTFGAGISYIDYGKMNITDNTGQVLNAVKSNEMCLQINASRNYKTKWRYGTALKFVNSSLATFNSSALMGDAGVVYFDTAKQFYFGMLIKNIGFQTKKYFANSGSEPLPFDMQLGVTKKLLKAPIRLNALVHHLYQWDIQYNNPADIISNSFFGTTDTIAKQNFADNLFRHFNFAVDLILSKNFDITVGYSHQRRKELAFIDKKGLSGFSLGANINFKKMQVHYARNTYNLAGNYNEIGVNLKMHELFCFGKDELMKEW